VLRQRTRNKTHDQAKATNIRSCLVRDRKNLILSVLVFKCSTMCILYILLFFLGWTSHCLTVLQRLAHHVPAGKKWLLNSPKLIYSIRARSGYSDARTAANGKKVSKRDYAIIYECNTIHDVMSAQQVLRTFSSKGLVPPVSMFSDECPPQIVGDSCPVPGFSTLKKNCNTVPQEKPLRTADEWWMLTVEFASYPFFTILFLFTTTCEHIMRLFD
jgi:hypothetical protein